MGLTLTNPFGAQPSPIQTSALTLPSPSTPSPMTGNTPANNGSDDDDDSGGGLSSLASFAGSINLPTNGGTDTVADITDAASQAASGNYLGAISGLITNLFEGHAVRAKDAANENTQMNQIIPAVTAAFLQLVQGMNSGKYSASQVKITVANILATYNSFVKSLQTGANGAPKPGVADNGGTTCGKACTAGCCLRGNYVNGLATQVLSALQGAPVNQPVINPGGKYWVLGTSGIPANKYGFAGIPAYKVPIIFKPADSVEGIAASAQSEFTKFVNWIKGAF